MNRITVENYFEGFEGSKKHERLAFGLFMEKETEEIEKILEQEGLAIDQLITYSTGEKKFFIPYVNNKIEGTVIRYYKNGSIRSNTEFSNGLQNGKHEEFWVSGGKMMKSVYKRGSRVSLKEWDKSGNKIHEHKLSEGDHKPYSIGFKAWTLFMFCLMLLILPIYLNHA